MVIIYTIYIRLIFLILGVFIVLFGLLRVYIDFGILQGIPMARWSNG